MKKAWGFGLALLLIAVTALTVIIASRFKTTAQQEAEATAPQPSVITAHVTQQKITDTIPVTCKVSYNNATDLVPTSISPNAQYTKITVAEGETLKQGTLAAEINGQPVFIGIGPFSFYRDLHLNDRGPDAKMLNDILTDLGYQHSRSAGEADIFDQITLTALGNLYSGFNYSEPSKDTGFKASSFIIFKNEQKVVSPPRETGTVGTTPIAKISQNTQQITCTGLSGTLSPEIKAGQNLKLYPSSGELSTVIEAVTAPVVESSQKAEQANAASAYNTATSKIIARYVEIPDAEKSFSAEVVLSESSGQNPVVPSAALWAKEGQTLVTIVEDGRETNVPVQVLYSARGFNEVKALEGTLSVGSTIKINTEN